MEALSFTWWFWVVAGLILMAAEILTPGGFFIVFFGFGAVATGVLKLFGMEVGTVLEILIFVVISVGGLFQFRQKLLDQFGKPAKEVPDVDSLVSQVAVAIDDLVPGQPGKVELRGTAWNAENLGAEPILKTHRCRVERVDGLTLYVRAIS